MTRRMWTCEDCGWEWPYPTEPPEEAECDSCGGPLEKVSEVFVAPRPEAVESHPWAEHRHRERGKR